MTSPPPRIEVIAPKQLIGIRLPRTTIAANRMAEAWRRFMPRRREVIHRSNTDVISLRCYEDLGGYPPAPNAVHDYWAAVEVTDIGELPEGMEEYTLTGGRYAVFIHHGPADAFARTYRFIHHDWLPRSGYALDAREHFEVLAEGYRPDDPDAREEVWIPIRAVDDKPADPLKP